MLCYHWLEGSPRKRRSLIEIDFFNTAPEVDHIHFKLVNTVRRLQLAFFEDNLGPLGSVADLERRLVLVVYNVKRSSPKTMVRELRLLT